jgi:hypothetical protein
MSLPSFVQFATLLSFLIGLAGLGIAVLIHRQQAETQIFLALSDRYDELLKTVPAGLSMSGRPDMILPEPSGALTIFVLRYYTHVSFSYFLFQRRRIPASMWKQIVRSLEHTLRSPLFVREWKSVRSEFEAFPDFVALVSSIQEKGDPAGRARTEQQGESEPPRKKS